MSVTQQDNIFFDMATRRPHDIPAEHHARIARLYYGAPDPKGGAVEHGARVFEQPQCLHRPEVYSGIGEAQAADLLRDFFAARR